MRTYYDPDATALSLPSSYTIPSDYLQSSDHTGAAAWASSPLGDPAVDDDDFFAGSGRRDPERWAVKPRSYRTGAAVAAALLGTLGFGAALGMVILDFATPPAATSTFVVPGAASVPAPATPQPPSAASVAPAPAAIASQAAPAAPNRVVVRNGGEPAVDPGPGIAAGPAADDATGDVGSQATPPPPAVVSTPPAPPILHLPKFLPPLPIPVPVKVPLPVPVPVKVPAPAPPKGPSGPACKPLPFCI